MFVLGLDWWVMHDVVHLVALLLLALVLVLLPYLLGLAMLLAAHLLDLAMLHAVCLLELDLAMLLAVCLLELDLTMLLAVHLLRLNLAVLLAVLPGVMVTCCSLLIIYGSEYEQYSSVVSTVGGLPVRGIFGGGVESSISSVRKGFSSYSGRS